MCFCITDSTSIDGENTHIAMVQLQNEGTLCHVIMCGVSHVFVCVFASRNPFCTVVWPSCVDRNAEESAKDRAIASCSR